MSDTPVPASSDASLSEFEQERRRKRDELKAAGVNPYGVRTEGLQSLADARAKHDPDAAEDNLPSVKIAGRIVLKRDMGKLSFLTLRDETGDLQVGLMKNKLSDLQWTVRKNLDLGDQIVIEGGLGTTKTGEPTVWAEGENAITMAAKALVPPPDKHEGLKDVELRYRQRYVDLWSNPEVMKTMKLRQQIIASMRKFLVDRGYTEVETPMLQSLQGGAAARPFNTHHNAYDIPLFLRIAPELFLKRLLVGGYGKVFEINRNFRNEGVSPRHNPEFTMLEAYEAFGNWETMAEMVESMICSIAEEVCGGLVITHGRRDEETERQRDEVADGGDTTAADSGAVSDSEPSKEARTINLTRPWRKVSMAQLVEEKTGWTFNKEPHPNPEQFGEDFHKRSPAEQLVEVFEKKVEHSLIDPTFVTRIPSVIIPLARPCEDDPYFADVYELIINGQEISPGYTELNDPDVQESLFRQQVGDEAEKQAIDHDFLNALKVGMPPAGGMGLGVDRLVMLLTGAESIRDVLLFPLMKPVGQEETKRRRDEDTE